MSMNENYCKTSIVNKNYKKQLSTLSRTTSSTNEKDFEIINHNKKHITFKDNFLTIIEVESWKELNIDVTETDPDWEKVQSNEINKNNINDNINQNNNVITNQNKVINIKKKISCDCTMF
jgi:hypothetical protein